MSTPPSDGRPDEDAPYSADASADAPEPAAIGDPEPAPPPPTSRPWVAGAPWVVGARSGLRGRAALVGTGVGALLLGLLGGFVIGHATDGRGGDADHHQVGEGPGHFQEHRRGEWGGQLPPPPNGTPVPDSPGGQSNPPGNSPGSRQDGQPGTNQQSGGGQQHRGGTNTNQG